MIRRLWPFIMGSVALGLDAYVIAGLLPAISTSLASREATVGLGVAAFTGAYALVGPVLAGSAGRHPSRSLAIALTIFTVANIATALSPTVWVFLVARVVAGAAAGVYSPLSSAIAAALVGAEQRGRALSLVLAGLAGGTVFGVPVGLMLAERWGWRSAIALIVITGALAMVGIVCRDRNLPEVPASSLRQRLRAITRTDNLVTVTVTLLTGVASLGLYTYLALVLGQSSLSSHQTLAIWVWGIGGAIGALGIGRVVDRGHPLRLSLILLVGLACALAGMTASEMPAVLLVSLLVWGVCGWASLTPQQHILIAANPEDGATAVAANASANYLGSALGAVCGSVLVGQDWSAGALCLAAAAVAAGAVLLQLVRTRMGHGLG